MVSDFPPVKKRPRATSFAALRKPRGVRATSNGTEVSGFPRPSQSKRGFPDQARDELSLICSGEKKSSGRKLPSDTNRTPPGSEREGFRGADQQVRSEMDTVISKSVSLAPHRDPRHIGSSTANACRTNGRHGISSNTAGLWSIEGEEARTKTCRTGRQTR